MFQQPSQGDQVKISDLLGSLVLIYARELREQITTSAGISDAIGGDLHVLDGPKAGDTYENTLIFGKALVGSLRNAIGGDPVLGRVGQGVANPGKNAPWILQPYSDADAALATAWINSRPKFGQPVSGQPANPTSGQSAAGSTPATTPAASSATSTAPTAPANGMTAEAFQGLPPEVQELLRKSGQVPAGV